MRRRTGTYGMAAGVAVAAALAAGPVMAAAPVIERTLVDDVFVDRFLTQQCGVPVVTRAQGAVTTRTFAGRGTGPRQLTTVNVRLTATAGENTVRFRDVGADLVRQRPDGTLLLSISGQVPFEFTGVLKIDLTTGGVVQEPQHRTDDDLQEVCAVLTS